VQRFVDRAAVAKAVTALLSRPAPDVASASGRLWASLFGEPLGTVLPN